MFDAAEIGPEGDGPGLFLALSWPTAYQRESRR
jgi:hypothetical protein